jgi:hypothetical protein
MLASIVIVFIALAKVYEKLVFNKLSIKQLIRKER